MDQQAEVVQMPSNGAPQVLSPAWRSPIPTLFPSIPATTAPAHLLSYPQTRHPSLQWRGLGAVHILGARAHRVKC